MKAELIVQQIIIELDSRSGFGHWWWNIDIDIRKEILEKLASVVNKELKSWKTI